MSWVVTARLSFVPAKPIRRRLIRRERASARTRRFVSHALSRKVAIVYAPSTAGGGGWEISSTMKSSGEDFRTPPTPGVDVRYPSIPTSDSMVLRELLFEELLRRREFPREALRDPFQCGLGTAFLHADREGGLVELRMARVVQGVLHVRILQEGCDQWIEDRVVGVRDLDLQGIFLLLEDAEW